MAAAPPARAQLTAADRAALGDLAAQFAERFELSRGWYRGRPIHYFDFGPAAVTISPIFFVVTGFDADGTPRFVAGQRPIFATIPGVPGYSAIWQVHYLVVGPGYLANTVRDGRTAVAMALAGTARLVVPGVYVNCPIVAHGSSLVGDPDARPLLAGWYKGAEVAFFDFGRAPLAPAPIYVFVTGFSGDEPQFLRAQGSIVDVVPGDGAEYRDMWDVHFAHVGLDYQPDRIQDAVTLLAEAQRGTITIRRAGAVRNCPVVLVDDRPAPRRGLAS